MSKNYKQTGRYKIAAALKPYICGGTSACFASFCIHPIDVTKVRLQLIGEGTRGKGNAFNVVQNILRTDGFRGLYVGFSASFMRQVTYGTARIGLYTAFSDAVKDSNFGGAPGTNLPWYWKFATSFSSGALVPSLTPHHKHDQPLNFPGPNPSTPHTYRPSLIRAICMNVGMMASYDQVREFTDYNLGEGRLSNLAAAAAAGFFCAFCSLPPDLLKTRLMSQKQLPSGELPYSGVLDTVTKVWRHEGLFSFWRGFGAYYTRCAPHAMVILITREELTKLYQSNILDD